MEKVTKDTTIEDLVTDIPDSVTYLMENGIRCIRCGELIWGTLESAAIEKGFTQKDVERFVAEINELGKAAI